MNKKNNQKYVFECQVCSLDNFGRSDSLWISVFKSEDIEKVMNSAFDQIDKQREDKDKLEFQIIDGEGSVIGSLKPPHDHWSMSHPPSCTPDPAFVYLKDFKSLENRVKIMERGFLVVALVLAGTYLSSLL